METEEHIHANKDRGQNKLGQSASSFSAESKVLLSLQETCITRCSAG
jgi:hypothetical protein